jgi:hypothetical protein
MAVRRNSTSGIQGGVFCWRAFLRALSTNLMRLRYDVGIFCPAIWFFCRGRSGTGVALRAKRERERDGSSVCLIGGDVEDELLQVVDPFARAVADGNDGDDVREPVIELVHQLIIDSLYHVT